MRTPSQASWTRLLLGACLAAGLLPATATAARRPVVVELFTSEGCSSCPPADRLLGELAASGSDILALDLHVTYWNALGWKDPFALPAATERQRRYAELFASKEVFTPQMVVDGRESLVGSDREAVGQAIGQAASRLASAAPAVALQASLQPSGLLRVEVGEGAGEGVLLVLGFDAAHDTPVRGGENGGRTLHEVDVVRSLQQAGDWHGAASVVQLPRPAGEQVAVLLQAPDGQVLAAARAVSPAS